MTAPLSDSPAPVAPVCPMRWHSEGLALRWKTRRGGSAIRHFAAGRAAVADVNAALLTRFRAREESELLWGDHLIGGVTRVDRWTWWLDAHEAERALAAPEPRP